MEALAMAALPFSTARAPRHGSSAARIVVRAQAKASSSTDKKDKKEKKKRSPSSSSSMSSSSSSSRQRDFEDGMLIWDDVFERCCEEPERVAAVMAAAEKGLIEHGRGCVFVREIAMAVSKGAGTGFLGRSRPLDRSKKKKPAFYKSESYTVEYVPRKFILDPKLAPSDDENEQEQTLSKDQSTSLQVRSARFGLDSLQSDCVRLVRRKDLIAVLRGMDRTRVLSLTSERLIKDSITARSVQKSSEEDEFDAGGEEPYMPSKSEIVLLLHVEFDGMPSVGADVVQAASIGDGWKLRMRDYQLYE